MKRLALVLGLVLLAVAVLTWWAGHSRPQAPLAGPTAPVSPDVGLLSPTALQLPNPKLTPGWPSADVTPANLARTICRPGYTAGRRLDDGRSVRPDNHYTHVLELVQLRELNYADRDPSHFEEDHLIPLELGGDGYDQRNLWPQPYSPRPGAREKDQLENRLHDLVCLGRLELRAAQSAIAINWWAAYQRYVD